MDLDRRSFLKTGIAAAGVVASSGMLNPLAAEEASPARPSAGAAPPATQPTQRRGDMPYRPLGKTGQMVSLLGVGGWHIGATKDQQECIRIIRTAIDNNANFMDNCWDYHDGKSEEWMGAALQDGYRDKAFLMSKFDGRTKKPAAKQIDESLKRLKTDRIDLMQIHEIIRLEDPDVCFRGDGCIHALLDAQKAGKVRFIGFTGHKDPIVHLRMLRMAEENGVRFDAVQMPLNVFDAHFRSFEKEVLPVLVEQQIGVLAMKTLASGAILKTNTASATQCLHYAMNLPSSTVITGCETMERLEQGLQAAKTFQPMSREQVASLLAKTREPALTGDHERFKTGTNFDGTAHHPEWMG
jgi:aryl-alcohol dehydrogenase-like predicted oxidoreductase